MKVRGPLHDPHNRFAYPELLEVVPTTVIDDVFIDLDGVTADFEHEMTAGGHEANHFKLLPGSYIWLPPIKHALESIELLVKAFPGRVWFLTKPPKFSPYAYVEKALWVQRFFGDDGLHQLIVSQNKGLVGADRSILIDDRPHKGGVENFRGQVIHFASPKVPDWKATLNAICQLVAARS